MCTVCRNIHTYIRMYTYYVSTVYIYCVYCVYCIYVPTYVHTYCTYIRMWTCIMFYILFCGICISNVCMYVQYTHCVMCAVGTTLLFTDHLQCCSIRQRLMRRMLA